MNKQSSERIKERLTDQAAIDKKKREEKTERQENLINEALKKQSQFQIATGKKQDLK